MEDDISSKVLKLADYTKVFRKVTNDTDKQSLQDSLKHGSVLGKMLLQFPQESASRFFLVSWKGCFEEGVANPHLLLNLYGGGVVVHPV